MLPKKAIGVLGLLSAAAALAWMGGPVLAKAQPSSAALVSASPLTRHTALVKGAGEEVLFPVLDLTHSIVSPRDAASGLPTGKRLHKPFSITKHIDKASPSLLQGLIEGEPFEVEVTSYRRTGGRWTPFLAVKLDRAFIASIGPQSAGDRPTEEVAFYYNKIAFSYAESGKIVEDNWGGEYP